MNPLIFLQNWSQELNKTTLFNPIIFPFLFIFCLLYLFKATRSSNLNLPPSPWKLPIIGNLHQLDALLHRRFQVLSDKYGPVMLLHLGSSPLLVISSAEAARDIMMNTQDVFAERPRLRAARALFFGCRDIAFSPSGHYWRQAKKLRVQELLSPKRVQEFQFVREEEVANMVAKISLSSLSGAEVDLSDMFTAISNNIVSRCAIGRVYEGDGSINFAAASKTAVELTGALCFEDMFPIFGWMDNLTGFAAKLKSTSTALHNFLDQVIEEHQISRSHNDKPEKKDFVDLLLSIQEDGGLDIDLTHESIKGILLDMFIGGTDTTATTMEWAMAELVKNPSLMRKAQEEIRRVVGEKSRIDETHVNQMEYLKCIIKETLRLHAPFQIARATAAGTKLGGYDIPPGTIALINSWAIQRDPNLWDRPEEFLPERFANISVDFHGQLNQFIPFGAGRRSCPGIHFADVEAEYVLANLLYWFDWKLPDCGKGEELDMSDDYVVLIRKNIPLCLVPLMCSS